MGLTPQGLEIFTSPDPVVSESRRLLSLVRELFALKPSWNTTGDQQHLLQLADQLEKASRLMGGQLFLGLLGGTGVGKSTLISALAGEEISLAGPLRPLSTKPLMYHHQDFSPPPDFKGQTVAHKLNRLSFVTIIDFPDFDSRMADHHQQVLDYLPHLDLVVWLTDYHKYGDRRLYEVMDQARQKLGDLAQVALLNKIDELTSRPGGEEAAEQVLSEFSQLLTTRSSWSGPRPWAVSALAALATPGDTQAGGLNPFLHFLLTLAEEKVRLAVKMGNLEARNRSFQKNITSAAPAELWNQEARYLNEYLGNFNPQPAIAGDLATLELNQTAFLAPKLDQAHQNSRGLLALFTDLWDFATHRFREASPKLRPQPPEPTAPALDIYLAGARADLAHLSNFSTVENQPVTIPANQILGETLAQHFNQQPRPTSALLWLWPLALGLVLTWAETGGVYGGPATLTAAALRALVPWLILGFTGEIVLSRFIWYRTRKNLERNFRQTLNLAAQNLTELAQKQGTTQARQALAHRHRALELLGSIAPSKPGTTSAPD